MKIKKGHFQNNLLSFMTTFFIGVIGLLSFMILIRTYPKEVYADWVFYIAIVTFIDWLRGGLISSALIKHISGVTDHKTEMEILGSSWIINFMTVIIIALICYVPLCLFGNIGLFKKVHLVMTYFPLFVLFNSVVSMHITRFQIQNNFLYIFVLRIAISLGILIFYTANILWLYLPIEGVIGGQIVILAIASFFLLIRNGASINSIFSSKMRSINKLLHFGKYSMGIAIGGNLLSSSDIFIIGMMMTKVDVALYSVPLKIIEYIQIIISSFSDVAYPHMSKYCNANELTRTKKIFYQYAGTLTILFMPAIIFMMIFAKYVILLMSGQEYASSRETIYILQLFLISALFLPVDRFSGTLLDSMGLPKYNFMKVMLMVCVNIVGDFIAIVFFQSLELVAVITIVTTLNGLLLSYKYIFMQMKINFMKIFPYGFDVCKNGLNELLRRNIVGAKK